MQAVKEKLQDMNQLRKAKAEAKDEDMNQLREAKAEARDEEKAEKEIAKARLEVAREERLAKEAQAVMNMHVERAAEKVAAHEKTLSPQNNVTSDLELYSMSVNNNKSGKLIGDSGRLIGDSGMLIANSGRLVCGSGSAGNQESSDDYRSKSVP